MIELGLLALLVLIIIWAIAAIPLHLAVKLLGGQSSILKVMFVNVLVALLAAIINYTLGLYAGIASFIVMLLVYKVAFEIGWLKALFAWILQFVIVGAILWVLIALLGISIFAL